MSSAWPWCCGELSLAIDGSTMQNGGQVVPKQFQEKTRAYVPRREGRARARFYFGLHMAVVPAERTTVSVQRPAAVGWEH